MSVLDRAALEASPLADLHAIASELSIDGYRRLRREPLIDAILDRQAPERPDSEERVAVSDEPVQAVPEAEIEAEAALGADAAVGTEAGTGAEATVGAEAPVGAEAAAEGLAEDIEEVEPEPPARRRRGRRGGRGRGGPKETETGQPAADEAEPAVAKAGPAAEPTEPTEPAEAPEQRTAEPEEEIVEGVVELLPNGSGFLRVKPPEPSDEDVYISAAQVKRCELVSGDHIAGPRRTPRRSERFASLVRIDSINGRSAEEVAESTRFDDLPATFPTNRFELNSDDPTVKAIELLTPFGRGSRVTIVGSSRAGKTEALKRLAGALAGQDGVQVSLALAGVRPEEVADWGAGQVAPAVAVSFAFSPDAQANAVELVVDQARRVATRGAHALVLIDTLDGLHQGAARKAIAAARNLVEGGSLTVIATASEPIGGETTVIALDRNLTSAGRFPAVDLAASGTIRPELLVGEDGAAEIARARSETLHG